MDRHQVRAALLKISLVALAASTWIFTSFVFATRPEELAPAAEGPISGLVRLPASLPSQIPGMKQVVKPMDPIAMDAMNVPCWDKPANREESTDAKWMRLTGRDCAVEHGSADSVSVRNLSNGFSATVFPTQGKPGMTTDFIPLEVGKNRIQFKFNRGEGATVESQISFIRE